MHFLPFPRPVLRELRSRTNESGAKGNIELQRSRQANQILHA